MIRHVFVPLAVVSMHNSVPSKPPELDLENLGARDLADYHAWLRLRDLSPEDDKPRLRHLWSQSKRRGKHALLLDRKRRRMFGPGKFYAASPTGWYLNKNFVKGWGGVNPVNP